MNTSAEQTVGRRAAPYIAAMEDLFSEAADGKPQTVSLSLANGRRVDLEFAHEAMLPMARACRHREIPPADARPADLRILFFDSVLCGVDMPPPPWPPNVYGRNGEIMGWNDDHYSVNYYPHINILRLFDRHRGVAVFWFRDWRELYWWIFTFPVRDLLHWWLAFDPFQPAHAGAVGNADSAVLITGKSGSGKTTSTLACLEAGMGYLNDDYILLQTAPEPFVESLYNTAKIENDNLHRFPGLQPLISNPDRRGSEKAVIHVNEHRPQQMLTRCPLQAVIVPRVTGEKDSSLTPARTVDAYQALAPTTICQLPGFGAAAAAKLDRLVRTLPVYWLNAGTELEQIPPQIKEVL